MANVEYCTMAMELKDKIGGMCILKEGMTFPFLTIHKIEEKRIMKRIQDFLQ